MSRILFVADAGPAVGGGHAMRSLTLARALERLGQSCAFLAPPAVGAVLTAFAPDMAQVAGPFEAAFDAVVFDHYGLGAADHRALAAGRPSLAIDDLANRPLAADLIVDVGLSRQAEDYLGLVPPQAHLLIGPSFALVREEFAALREATLARRWAGGPVGRILVSLGLTDVGAITARVVERLGGLDAALDVVVGRGAPSLPRLAGLADRRLTLHVETGEMARLTSAADLAIGAGGSSSWERCVLGLPTVLVVLAPNQQLAADALTQAGAAIGVDAGAAGFEAAFDEALSRLVDEPARRSAQSDAAAALCDGRGADRVAESFVSHLAGRVP